MNSQTKTKDELIKELQESKHEYNSLRELFEKERSENKITAKKLEAAEEKFLSLFENQVAANLIIDPDNGTIFDANEAAAQFYGWKIDELKTMQFSQINISPIEEINKISHTIRTKQKSYFETKHLIADGSIRDVSVNGSRVIINGKVYHFVLINDITERKQLESVLEEKISLMENSQELARLGSYRIDIPSQTIFLSPEMAELYGADRKAINLPLEEYRKQFNFPDDFERSSKLADYAYLSGTPLYLESRVIRTDGKVIWIQTRSKTLSNGRTILGVVQDITERKLAEEALKTSENEFKLLAESMPQIVWITRSDGWNIYFNQQWVEYTGLSLEESYGHGWNKPFHPDDQQRAWDVWQNAIKNNGSYSLECQLRRKDGIYRWWLIRGVPVLNIDGSISKWFGTCTDIHNLKLAEQELFRAKEEAEENEENLRAIFENSLDALRVSKDGYSVMVNSAFMNLYGYSNKDEVIGKSLLENIHTTQRIQIEQNIQKRSRGEYVPSFYESIGVRKNGETFPFEIKVGEYILKNEKYSLSIIRDITERHLAEESFLKSEQRFKDLFNLSPIAIALLDKHGHLLVSNAALSKMVGYSNNELSDMTFAEFTHPEDVEKDMSQFDALYEGKISEYNMEKRYIHKNGNIVWGNLWVTIRRDSKGKPEEIIGMAEDITKRKLVEEELKQSEQKFRRFIEEAPLAVIASLNGKLSLINENALRLIGIKNAEEVEAKQIFELFAPDYQEMSKERTKLRSLGLPVPTEFESVLQRADGKMVPVQIAVSQIHLTVGKINIAFISDLTERKKSEDALRESEELYRNLVERLRDGVYRSTHEGKYVEVNSALVNMLGYESKEDLMNIDIKSELYLDPLDREKIILQEELDGFDIFPLKKKDGTVIWCEDNGWYLRDENGNINFHEGIMRDITKRREAEFLQQESNKLIENQNQKLIDTNVELIKAKVEAEESEENLKAIFDNSLDAIRVSDNYSTVMVNDAFMKLFGLSDLNEIVGKSFLEFIHPNEREKLLEYRRKRRLGEFVPIFYESIGIRKNGEEFPFEIKVAQYILKDQRYSLSILRDITERKKTELNLIKAKENAEESEFFLGESQKAGSIGSFKADFISGSWKSSESLDLIFGIDKNYNKSIQGWLNIIHPDDREMMNSYLLNEVIAKHCDFNREYRILRKNDKSVRWVIGKGKVGFDEKGYVIALIGTIQDITQRKEIENELIKSKEKAEESDRLKSAFLANMSHEIRTPMNGILGFAELLKDSKISSEERQEYISLIEKSGARMLNIINDIVDISKIESGQMTFNITASNINEQIEYVYTFFKPEVEQKGMQLFYKNALSSKESIIKTDREKVFAILTNLVKNAIKYSEKGKIEFGYITSGDYLEFFVKDQGIGIPKDRQEAIFERFIQADIGDKRAFQGAGLGLAITKNYVEMLGGKIWVESQEGKGSKFYFTLPFNADPKKEFEVKKVNAANDPVNLNKKLKILIVEDDEPSEKLIAVMMKSLSNSLIKVRTGVEAVEACRNNSDIDLILMDIQMPEMDGYEATRQIRQFNKDIIIIAQTAFGLSGDREKAIEAGCNDYIAKPIDLSALKRLINKHFKN